MLEALHGKGLRPGHVDSLILTHLHLDHAGGARLLLSQLPNARLTVLPRGARGQRRDASAIASARGAAEAAGCSQRTSCMHPL